MTFGMTDGESEAPRANTDERHNKKAEEKQDKKKQNKKQHQKIKEKGKHIEKYRSADARPPLHLTPDQLSSHTLPPTHLLTLIFN